MPDPPMTQSDKVFHGVPHGRPVVHAHRGSGARHGGPVEGDCRQTQCRQQRGPLIVRANIGDEDAVYPTGLREFLVGSNFGVLVGDQSDDQ